MSQSPSDRPGRLRVGLVGSGRAGSVVGAALDRAGHRVFSVAAVSAQSRGRATALVPRARIRAADDAVRDVDLAVLAVPDDVLADVVGGLAATGALHPGQLIVHLSGAHGLGVLDPATRLGALPLALHPVLTFTGQGEEDLQRLIGTSFGVTAPDALRPVAEALVVEMGGEPVWIADADRAAYHAALAFGANHLATLVNDARDILAGLGVAEPAQLLAPLLEATVDASLRHGDRAATGPVVRGDAETVRAHLSALAVRSPRSVPAYRALARLTADRALDAGQLDPSRAEALLGVLAARPGESS